MATWLCQIDATFGGGIGLPEKALTATLVERERMLLILNMVSW